MDYIYLIIKQTHDMKKIIASLLVIVFLFGCKKESAEPQTIQQVIAQLPPMPASGLETIIMGNNSIELSWTDNSTNETGFKIERKSERGQYSIVATLGKDITLYKDTGLLAYSKYTYRVYSYNNIGSALAYSNESISIIIPTIKIGSQTWGSTNLDVTTYSDGSPIPQIKDSTLWATTKSGAWCWYNNDSLNYSKLGKLYNWYAVNDPRGLAPIGYHVPSDAEWKILTDGLGGEMASAQKMKSTTGWYSGNWSSNTGTRYVNGNGNNSSGFNILPSGMRLIQADKMENPYNSFFIGKYSSSPNLSISYIWSTDEEFTQYPPMKGKRAKCKVVRWYYSDPTLMSSLFGISSGDFKESGMHVRIIKN